MSLLDQLILSRRSVRKWKETPISQEVIDQLLTLAIHVPSPTFSQPLRIVSHESKESREKLKHQLEEGLNKALASTDDPQLQKRYKFYYRYSTPMLMAPTLWEIQGIPTTSITNQVLSIGASLQNIILKAEELGIRGCQYGAPLHFLPEEPGDNGRLIFLALGYPNEEPSALNRLSPSQFFTQV